MLAVNGLSKTYSNGVHALENFSLNVGAGEIVAVIGGSGCGKSTLLRLISGLEPPTAGTVSLDGVAVDAPHPSINLIFQEPRLLPWLTVDGNVQFGLHHLDKDARRERSTAALRKVHLEGQGGRLPKQLSGGQAQRVAIARALVTGPAVLLLDEPFSALDALTRAALQGHLLDIWADSRPTVILVTHDIEEAAALANRVIVMRPWPGRVEDEIAIDLPIGTERTAHQLDPYKQRIVSALNRSLGLMHASIG